MPIAERPKSFSPQFYSTGSVSYLTNTYDDMNLAIAHMTNNADSSSGHEEVCDCSTVYNLNTTYKIWDK